MVLTGPGALVGRWTPADETLNAEVALSTEVHRVAGPEPPGAVGWRNRGERWLGIRPEWSNWWINGVFELGRDIGEVDLVYSWMSPYESAVAAAAVVAGIG